MADRKRHPAVTLRAAAEAGLKSLMRELGHEPTDICCTPAPDIVLLACTRCALPMSAAIDYAEAKVEIVGEAVKLRCEAA